MLKLCELCVRFIPKRNFVTETLYKTDNTKILYPIINCRRKELNHYVNIKYGTFDTIPLASKGWHHKKSKGDFFIINSDVNSTDLLDSEKSFAEIGLQPEIIKSVSKLNVTSPTTIQACGIPSVLAGNNTLIAAETGCGKTFTYLLPLVQQIISWKSFFTNSGFNSPLGVVLVPGRELANQIGQIADDLSEDLPFSSKVVIGGRTKQKMLNPSFESTDLVIATLGALSKLVTTGIYKMNLVHHVVLDEADTLLDDSFNEKLLYFLKKIPLASRNQYGCQLTLASATLPLNLQQQLHGIVQLDSIKKIMTKNLHKVIPNVPQKFVRLGRSSKPAELLKLVKFDSKKCNPVVIFCNKSATCDWVSMFLNENNIKCVNLNGDMPWAVRTGKFNQFQNSEVNVISCTDIGSRGLDTIRVKHVINYDFPLHTADYIHRCGRTGRKGSPESCHVTNFISGPLEVELVQKIEASVRRMKTLPNVDGNITNVIRNRIMKSINEDMAKQSPSPQLNEQSQQTV